ncbi:MAG: hypothetical protein JSW45_00175 [Thiotrichales bacterium]|nr:MAG: hypothetical protein JSW45_00175 [Thiotrichales bacterium]
MEKQTYIAKLALYIRSDDADGELPDESMYELHYSKTAEFPIPPAPGVSVLTWRPTIIKEVIVDNNGEVICHFEDLVLPVDRFEALMDKYKIYLSDGGWEEDTQLRKWPGHNAQGQQEWDEVPLEKRINRLWENPRHIDLDSSFLYFISVSDGNGGDYRYVGRARNKSRLNEYRNYLKKIRDGEERGKKTGYRAVHFALYTAMINDWKIKCYPLENCNGEDATRLEKRRIAELKCNLNGARTWRVSQMPSLTIEQLLR